MFQIWVLEKSKWIEQDKMEGPRKKISEYMKDKLKYKPGTYKIRKIHED